MNRSNIMLKICSILALLIIVIFLGSCGPQKINVELNSPVGHVLIEEAVVTDRFPPGCDTAQAQCSKFSKPNLIIWVRFKDDSVGFGNLNNAYIVDSNGNQFTGFTGNGSYNGRMFISFIVPNDAKGFKFHWLDNPPVDLGV